MIPHSLLHQRTKNFADFYVFLAIPYTSASYYFFGSIFSQTRLMDASFSQFSQNLPDTTFSQYIKIFRRFLCFPGHLIDSSFSQFFHNTTFLWNIKTKICSCLIGGFRKNVNFLTRPLLLEIEIVRVYNNKTGIDLLDLGKTPDKPNIYRDKVGLLTLQYTEQEIR